MTDRIGGAMDTPFENDMFSMVYQAFKNLYPDKRCICEWVPELEESEDGEQPLGLTTFADDGEVYVDIVATITVTEAVEILAHELAHVAVGQTHGHDKAWEEAFDRIFEEYNRIGNEAFNIHEPMVVVSGKAYVRDQERCYDKMEGNDAEELG